MSEDSRKIITVSPSEFSYLWDQCPACYWKKYVQKKQRPRNLMPAIFNRIDAEIKMALSNTTLSAMSKEHGSPLTIKTFLPELPQDGKLVAFDGWVTSQPYEVPGTNISLVIRGKYDTLIQWEDESHGIVDFKTTRTKVESATLYERQLGGYVYSLKYPEKEKDRTDNMTVHGLIVYDPTTFFIRNANKAALRGHLTWQTVDYKEDEFLAFLDKVGQLLDQKTMPESAENCEYCKFARGETW